LEKKMRKTLFVLGLLCLLAFTACGGGGGDDVLNDKGSGGGNAGAAAAPPLTATLKGKIVFEGTAPTPKKIVTSSDPGCKNSDLTSEDVVVSDGGLENVILYVSGGLEGKKFPTTKDAVTLDQHGCHYVPHALTLMVGQPLKIVNSDDTAHNIHAWAEVNMPFNESQSSKGVETTKMFDKEEVLLPVRCDVHNWMNAFIGVFSHPLHTVSKKGGAYELKLPAGTYEITAEHEKFGKQTQMVTVADNGSAELNFTFKAAN
jgi:plastocyanin